MSYAINYTQYAYDGLGRLWKVIDAKGNNSVGGIPGTP